MNILIHFIACIGGSLIGSYIGILLYYKELNTKEKIEEENHL